jgi:UDP-glucose 4-epimerase
MAVLVTGGAGYIGSHTVRLLAQQQREVVVLDSLELGTKSRIGSVPFFEGNISDEKLIEKICKKHNMTKSFTLPHTRQSANQWSSRFAITTTTLLEPSTSCAHCLPTALNALVFSSSAAVYGNPSSVPVTEDSLMQPESVYAETKAVMERFLSSCEAIGMRTVSLRYFNAAGASSDSSIGEDWSMSQNLVPLVMKAILGFSGPLNVFGNDYPTPDGTCIRDYIHVEDLADAHIKALDYLATGGKSLACNVGTGKGTSVLEVLDIAEQVSGRKVPHVITQRRPGDPTAVFADPTLVRALLGWKATQDLRDIISSAWNWHSKAENN